MLNNCTFRRRVPTASAVGTRFARISATSHMKACFAAHEGHGSELGNLQLGKNETFFGFGG